MAEQEWNQMYSVKRGGGGYCSCDSLAVSAVPSFPPLRAAATGMVGLQELRAHTFHVQPGRQPGGLLATLQIPLI